MTPSEKTNENCGHLAIDGAGRCEGCFEFVGGTRFEVKRVEPSYEVLKARLASLVEHLDKLSEAPTRRGKA